MRVVIEGLIRDWKYEEALPKLEKFASYGGDYSVLAKYKLAQLHAAMDNFEEANAVMDQLMQSNQEFLPEYLLILEKGRISALEYLSTDDEAAKLAAEAAFTQIVNQFPNAPIHASASRELDKIRGVSEETVVASESSTAVPAELIPEASE